MNIQAEALFATRVRLVVMCLAPVLSGCARETAQPSAERKQAAVELQGPHNQPLKEKAVRVEYLEIVTPKVDETCDALARAHGVTFSDLVAELGNARTTNLRDGGRIGVRAPMHAAEAPVVRPYVLVQDIEVALKAVVAAGGEIAMEPTPIPGQCTFAIYVLGGIEHGLWQK